MAKRSILTWVLGVAVVFLTVALTLETAYMVWLHRQLSTAVLGTDSSLRSLDKLLATDLGGIATETQKPGSAKGSPLLGTEPLSVTDTEGIQRRAEEIVGQAFSDPALKDLLDDLGIEPPAGAPVPESFNTGQLHPSFSFRETGDRYIVTVSLPGVKDADVRAVVQEGILKVSGTRRGVQFSESFAFPGPVVVGSENIEYRNGRLTVTARKSSPHGNAAEVT